MSPLLAFGLGLAVAIPAFIVGLIAGEIRQLHRCAARLEKEFR